ncbi:hypothetical protein L7F22_043846 [Adiantum nelumboides]|nr:hypothetical protein [Adiantum nelumboides]
MLSLQWVTFVTITLSISTLSSRSQAAPSPYPLNPSDATVIDSETACNALKTSIPLKLANAKSTKHSAPLQLTNVITKFYLNGDNPTTQELYNDIPSTAFANETDSINAIVNSAGDWDRDSVMADQGYGLEDSIQTQQGGLPSFCRFGASIITSNSSMTWFETWLPVPSNGTDYSITPTTIFSDPLAADMDSGSDQGFDFKRRRSSSKKRLVASPPQPSNPAPVIVNGIASRENWRGRLVFVGSGGQRGSCSYPEMKQVLARYREATASSNLGHFGTGATTTWTIGRPEAQTDFGYRGTHVSSIASQFVVKQFYGVTAAQESRSGSSGKGSSQKGDKGKKNDKGKKHKSPQGGKKKHSGNKRHNQVEERADKATESKAHFGFPTYYKGCSTGGRQGIAEAQRFPYDFDGVIAGSPAIYYNELNAYQIHVNNFQSDRSSTRYISQKLYPVIHKFILSECDTIDGLKDAVIENPAQCKPRFDLLLCAPTNLTTTSSSSTKRSSSSSTTTVGGLRIFEQATKTSDLVDSATSTQSSQKHKSQTVLEIAKRASPTKRHMSSKHHHHHSSSSSNASSSTPSKSHKSSSSSSTSSSSSSSDSPAPTYAPAGQCLTASQLANLKNIYKPYTYPKGEIIHEPVLYGSETVWTVNDGVVGVAFPPAPGWFQYQVLGQSDSPDSFDYFNIVDNNFHLIRQGNRMDPGSTETSNPDLSQFFNKGGKLMHYHGLADQLIPSGASDRFYNEVQNVVGGDLSDSYRYLRIPGMGHCRGGDGAWNYGGAGQTDEGSRPLEFSTQYDMLLALFDWVEKEKTPKKQYGAGYKITTGFEAPDYVTTTKDIQKYSNGVKFTHRFCPYPAQVVVTNNSTDTETCKVVVTSTKSKN